MVEDHADIREMVELFLSLDGFAVCTAGDGLDALGCVAERKPCLILLDVNMPRMDGINFGRELRRHRDPDVRNTPIVLLTALNDVALALEATKAVEVLRKPVSFDRLVRVVEEHCRV